MTLQLAVYQRSSNGTMFFKEDGRRVTLRHNTKWVDSHGRQRRGPNRHEDTLPSSASDEWWSSDEDLERALAASLESEEPQSEVAQIEAAIQASLQDVSSEPSARLDASTAASASCSVCLEDITRGQNARALRCGHVFHTQCIARWLRTSRLCPICREDA